MPACYDMHVWQLGAQVTTAFGVRDSDTICSACQVTLPLGNAVVVCLGARLGPAALQTKVKLFKCGCC